MSKRNRLVQVAVIGSSEPDPQTVPFAAQIGARIAQKGAVLICGGLGGMMDAAAQGAKQNGGLTVGILPDYGRESANSFIDIVVATGLGYARNILVVASGDLVIALPGSHGTRSEISIALKLGKPVIGFKTWGAIPGVQQVNSIEELEKELLPFF